jgi:hypothetical protein
MCVMFEEPAVGIEHVSAKLCIKIENISGISDIRIDHDHESCGTRTRDDCAGEAQQQVTANYGPVLTSERAPHINKPATR